MFTKLRAFLVHFGAIAHADASHLAHVPSALWLDVKDAFSTPADDAATDVKSALTAAEASVVKGDHTVVQLAAGDLAKLTAIVDEKDPLPESAPASGPTEAGGEKPLV